MAYESVASILGAEGERKTRRARRQYDRTAARRKRQARARRRKRHTRQRRELQELARETIPKLERRQARLSSLGRTETAGLFGESPEIRRQRRLSEVDSRLEAALAERASLAGKVRRRRGRRAEPVTLAEAGLAILSAAPPVRAGVGIAAGARALFATGGKKAATEASEQTVKRGLARTAAKTKEAARTVDAATSVRGVARGVQGKGITRARPVRQTARGGSRARRAGRAAGTVAKGGAKTVTFPIRHPLKTAKYSFAAQAPAALKSGDLSEFEKVLSGEGVAANVLRSVGETVSKAAPGEVATNLVKDVFDLPAQTVPAIYMPVAGIVEAAQGDSSRLEKLWGDYKKVGLLPAVVSGDPGGALKAIKEHPLFAALEARGAQAVIGRGAGAALRAGAAGRRGQQAASTQRKPLRIGGGLPPKPRQYSRDVIEKAVQVGADVRRARKRGGQKASPQQRERILRERVDRLVAAEEGARRAGRAEEGEAAMQSVQTGRRLVRRQIPKVEREAVSLAVQGIVRSPRTFSKDLVTYGQQLDRSVSRLRKQRNQATSRSERRQLSRRIKANREMRQRLDRIRQEADPERVFAASRQNVAGLRDIDRELVGQGLLAESQAAKSRLIPFARLHMGAKYGKPEGSRQRQLLDREGKPLSVQAVEQARRQQGAEETGFVSQSPSARGARSFYRGFFPDRQTIAKGKRTGKATKEGTFDPSFDAVVEQRIRGRGIVDAVKGFDRTVQEFAVGGLRLRNYREAQDVARNPRAHGLPDDLPLRPVRLAPLRATSKETRRAEELFDMMEPSNQRGLERITDDLIDSALNDGPGPVVLLPEQVVYRLREHMQAASTTRRAAQVLSSAFKGVVLPTSPNWFLGNLIDVSMRSMLSGTIPWGRNAALGRRVMREVKELDPDAGKRAQAGLVPGMVFGAADATRVFRDARQFAGTGLAPLARGFGALRRTPGVRQVVNTYVRYRNAAFGFNERFIERQSQYAQLGKQARREVRETTGQWHSALKLGDEAIRDLSKGLLKTENQIKFAKGIEETLGQWTANSPGARAFLVDYAPFGMWTRAASRFVLWTLPAKHPIKTAIGAAAYEMTKEEREALGLSLFADKALPPNLQGSIPTAGGGLISPQTLTSFGFFADYQQSLANSVLPQFPIAELAGLDWTGDRLTHEDGTPLNVAERSGAALVSMGEAYLPFLAMGQRVAKDGPQAALPRSVRPYDPGLVDYLREQSESRQISIPANPEPASEGPDYGKVFSGEAESSVDYEKVFGGG